MGKVLPMMSVTPREEAFMEVIIRLINTEIRLHPKQPEGAAVVLQQVTMRDGSTANMGQLHDGLGLGERRISIVREGGGEVGACELPARTQGGEEGRGGDEEGGV